MLFSSFFFFALFFFLTFISPSCPSLFIINVSAMNFSSPRPLPLPHFFFRFEKKIKAIALVVWCLLDEQLIPPWRIRFLSTTTPSCGYSSCYGLREIYAALQNAFLRFSRLETPRLRRLRVRRRHRQERRRSSATLRRTGVEGETSHNQRDSVCLFL